MFQNYTPFLSILLLWTTFAEVSEGDINGDSKVRFPDLDVAAIPVRSSSPRSRILIQAHKASV
jgi:hypothetical protein